MRNVPIGLAALMPHAPVLIPRIARERLPQVAATTAAMQLLARQAVAGAPDAIVVLSPHSPARPDAFAVWWTDPLAGSFETFQAASESVRLPLDAALARALEQEAAGRGLRTWRITQGTLDHGALVPLHYLAAAGWRGPTLVVGIQDADPGTLCALGVAINAASASLDRHIALIASGDMSHRLGVGAPCGYHPSAREFDHEFIRTLRTGGLDDLLALDTPLRELAAEDVMASTRVALAAVGNERAGRTVLSYEGPFGVGYGVAVLFASPAASALAMPAARPQGVDHPGELPAIARASVVAHFSGSADAPPFTAGGPLLEPHGVFVSIHSVRQELRGCRGCAQPLADLVRSTWIHAREAAFDDSRFEPVTEPELPDLRFSVSVLSPLERVASRAQLDPARYGVLITSADHGHRGLLLPGIPGIDAPAQQLRLARQKADIGPNEPITIERFTTELYAEAAAAETGGVHHAR